AHEAVLRLRLALDEVAALPQHVPLAGLLVVADHRGAGLQIVRERLQRLGDLRVVRLRPRNERAGGDERRCCETNDLSHDSSSDSEGKQPQSTQSSQNNQSTFFCRAPWFMGLLSVSGDCEGKQPQSTQSSQNNEGISRRHFFSACSAFSAFASRLMISRRR